MTIPTPHTAQADRAICPEHAERAAVGTCTRCGRFVCDDCQTQEGVCTRCWKLMASTLPALAPRARWASRFLGLHALTDAGWLLGHAGALAGMSESLVEAFEGWVGVATMVAVVGSAITFLRWLHLAVRQANALGVEVGVTPGWAVGWWFVPFSNMVKPYRVVRDLLGRLGSAADIRAARLPLWWGMWIVGSIFSQIETRMSLRSGLDAPEPSEARMVGIIANAALLLGAVLCIGVVRSVQGAFERRGE